MIPVIKFEGRNGNYAEQVTYLTFLNHDEADKLIKKESILTGKYLTWFVKCNPGDTFETHSEEAND